MTRRRKKRVVWALFPPNAMTMQDGHCHRPATTLIDCATDDGMRIKYVEACNCGAVRFRAGGRWSKAAPPRSEGAQVTGHMGVAPSDVLRGRTVMANMRSRPQDWRSVSRLPQRWWLLVKDVRGTVVYNRPFFFRRNAVRYGERVSSPSLNTYEVQKGWR